MRNLTAQEKCQANYDTRPGRKVMVAGIEWKWQIGSAGGVVAYSETGFKKFAKAWDILDITPEAWERGQRKRAFGLTPGVVAKWLR